MKAPNREGSFKKSVNEVLPNGICAKAEPSMRLQHKTVDLILNRVDARFAEISMRVLSVISILCEREISEVSQCKNVNVQHWHRRSEQCCGELVLQSEGRNIVPHLPFVVARSGSHLLSFILSEIQNPRTIIEKNLESYLLRAMFPDRVYKEHVMAALSETLFLRLRLKQALSDGCSMLKRAARDCSFQTLGYSSLLSICSAVTSENSSLKSRQAHLAKSNLLWNVFGGIDIET